MKRVVLLSAILSSLFANQTTSKYSLMGDDVSNKRYLIKLGACRYIENAKKIQANLNYPTQIIFLQDYYSVVSSEFLDKSLADEELKKLKQIKSDAYLITLYKKGIKSPNNRATPVKQEDNFSYAQTLFNSKKYEEALMEFDLLLIDNPNNLKARLYYAKALFKLGLYKDAKDEFKKALGYRLSEDEKREIAYYLDEIEKKTKRSFFNTTISVGIGYDDNINLTTERKTTTYGPYTLLNDTNKTSSTFGVGSILLNHKYEAELFDIYSSLYSYNEFSHSAKGNDLNFLDLSIAVAKSFENFHFSLPFGYNISYLDGKNIGYNIYTKPTISHSFNNRLTTYLESRYIDNTTKFAKHRDYRVFGASIGSRYEEQKNLLTLGISADRYRAKKDLRYDISRDEIGAYLYDRYYLLWGVSLSFNGSYVDKRYSDLDPVMGYKREDKLTCIGAGATKSITKDIDFDLSYQYRKNDSNVNAYSYDKNSYLFNVKYRF